MTKAVRIFDGNRAQHSTMQTKHAWEQHIIFLKCTRTSLFFPKLYIPCRLFKNSGTKYNEMFTSFYVIYSIFKGTRCEDNGKKVDIEVKKKTDFNTEANTTGGDKYVTILFIFLPYSRLERFLQTMFFCQTHKHIHRTKCWFIIIKVGVLQTVKNRPKPFGFCMLKLAYKRKTKQKLDEW